jgi:hypothetical protein
MRLNRQVDAGGERDRMQARTGKRRRMAQRVDAAGEGPSDNQPNSNPISRAEAAQAARLRLDDESRPPTSPTS